MFIHILDMANLPGQCVVDVNPGYKGCNNNVSNSIPLQICIMLLLSPRLTMSSTDYFVPFLRIDKSPNRSVLIRSEMTNVRNLEVMYCITRHIAAPV